MAIDSSKVRLAARFALRNSLSIIVTTILMVPAISVIHRIFDETWYVNWRLMVSISAILTTLFFAFLFVTQLLEFSTEERREQTTQLAVPGVMWLRGIYLAVIAMGIVLMVGTYKEGDPWWDVVGAVVFVLLGFLAWPRTIEITENEIRQRRFLLGWKRICYGEVERVVSDTQRNEAVVFGKSSERIVHTMMHVDRDKFIERVASTTGKNAVVVGNGR
jgi:hypothetical protein